MVYLLLDFFVERMLAKYWVILFQLNTLSGILAILSGDISGGTGLLGTFQNHLNPILFTSSHSEPPWPTLNL